MDGRQKGQSSSAHRTQFETLFTSSTGFAFPLLSYGKLCVAAQSSDQVKSVQRLHDPSIVRSAEALLQRMPRAAMQIETMPFTEFGRSVSFNEEIEEACLASLADIMAVAKAESKNFCRCHGDGEHTEGHFFASEKKCANRTAISRQLLTRVMFILQISVSSDKYKFRTELSVQQEIFALCTDLLLNARFVPNNKAQKEEQEAMGVVAFPLRYFLTDEQEEEETAGFDNHQNSNALSLGPCLSIEVARVCSAIVLNYPSSSSARQYLVRSDVVEAMCGLINERLCAEEEYYGNNSGGDGGGGGGGDGGGGGEDEYDEPFFAGFPDSKGISSSSITSPRCKRRRTEAQQQHYSYSHSRKGEYNRWELTGASKWYRDTDFVRLVETVISFFDRLCRDPLYIVNFSSDAVHPQILTLCKRILRAADLMRRPNCLLLPKVLPCVFAVLRSIADKKDEGAAMIIEYGFVDELWRLTGVDTEEWLVGGGRGAKPCRGDNSPNRSEALRRLRAASCSDVFFA